MDNQNKHQKEIFITNDLQVIVSTNVYDAMKVETSTPKTGAEGAFLTQLLYQKVALVKNLQNSLPAYFDYSVKNNVCDPGTFIQNNILPYVNLLVNSEEEIVEDLGAADYAWYCIYNENSIDYDEQQIRFKDFSDSMIAKILNRIF